MVTFVSLLLLLTTKLPDFNLTIWLALTVFYIIFRPFYHIFFNHTQCKFLLDQDSGVGPFKLSCKCPSNTLLTYWFVKSISHPILLIHCPFLFLFHRTNQMKSMDWMNYILPKKIVATTKGQLWRGYEILKLQQKKRNVNWMW